MQTLALVLAGIVGWHIAVADAVRKDAFTVKLAPFLILGDGRLLLLPFFFPLPFHLPLLAFLRLIIRAYGSTCVAASSFFLHLPLLAFLRLMRSHLTCGSAGAPPYLL